jgi:hypothetical protein
MIIELIGCAITVGVLAVGAQVVIVKRTMSESLKVEREKNDQVAQVVSTIQGHVKSLHEESFKAKERAAPSGPQEVTPEWQKIVQVQIDWAKPEKLWQEAIEFIKVNAPNDAAFRWASERVFSAMLGHEIEAEEAKPLAVVQAFKPALVPAPAPVVDDQPVLPKRAAAGGTRKPF